MATDPRTQALSADPNRTLMGGAPSLSATQTIQPVQCPVCKTFNPAGVMFCVECGLIFDRALPEDAFGAPAVRLPVLVDSSGREHPLRPGENVVGREGAVLIQSSQVSRRHARIVVDGDSLLLEDLGSTNGTTVDGERLEAGTTKTLSGGETLAFGGVAMRVQLPDQTGGKAQTLPSNQTATLAAPPQAAAPAAFLVGEGQRFPLRSGTNAFGRKPDNDVVIAEAIVSGKHGVLEVLDDGVYLTDLGSTNGTLVGDAPLQPHIRTRVQPGDVIKLGNLEFRVEAGG